jgi:nitrogen fixation NifU-like protein
MSQGTIYQSVILERSRSPRYRRPLAGWANQGLCRNPLCGDEVTVELRCDGTGRIEEAGFVAEGCAIMLASADLMAESVMGLAADQARSLGSAFGAMLEGGAPVANRHLASFAPLRDYQARRQCATLPWQALGAALSKGDQ